MTDEKYREAVELKKDIDNLEYFLRSTAYLKMDVRTQKKKLFSHGFRSIEYEMPQDISDAVWNLLVEKLREMKARYAEL